VPETYGEVPFRSNVTQALKSGDDSDGDCDECLDLFIIDVIPTPSVTFLKRYSQSLVPKVGLGL